MSILINMELPHACMDCIMSNLECDWCILLQSKIPQESRFENRMKQCPLVPIPPHGRLGDLDELKTAFPSGEYVRTESVRATIDHMRTIIPASEEGDCQYHTSDGRCLHYIGCPYEQSKNEPNEDDLLEFEAEALGYRRFGKVEDGE